MISRSSVLELLTVMILSCIFVEAHGLYVYGPAKRRLRHEGRRHDLTHETHRRKIGMIWSRCIERVSPTSIITQALTSLLLSTSNEQHRSNRPFLLHHSSVVDATSFARAHHAPQSLSTTYLCLVHHRPPRFICLSASAPHSPVSLSGELAFITRRPPSCEVKLCGEVGSIGDSLSYRRYCGSGSCC